MSLELGVNTEAIWEAIKDVVIKTIIRLKVFANVHICTYIHMLASKSGSPLGLKISRGRAW